MYITNQFGPIIIVIVMNLKMPVVWLKEKNRYIFYARCYLCMMSCYMWMMYCYMCMMSCYMWMMYRYMCMMSCYMWMRADICA